MTAAYNKVTRQWDSFDDTNGLSLDWVIDPVFDNQELAMALGQDYWQFSGNVITTITQGEYDTLKLAELKAKSWALIQAERERRLYTLGVQVGADWFHTDAASRVQFIGLTAYGSTMPSSIYWKTMTGSFVLMTPILAAQIVSSIASMDAGLFAYAEQLKGLLYASAEPANFNIYTGWPTTFTSLTMGDLSGNYTKVTTDAMGRVISGSNPTTLAGIGITDAISVSEKATANGVATLDASAKVLISQMPDGIVSPTTMQTIAQKEYLSQTNDITGILQPILARNKVGYWCPPGNATTVPGVTGMTAVTGLGTATARNIATTNLATRMKRVGYPSASTAGSFGGIRTAAVQYTCGSGVVRDGSGFTYIAQWVESTPAVVAGQRSFAGMSSATAAPSNVESNTLTNSIGIGQLSTDSTQWYWIQGGSAAQTAIAIGTAIGSPAGNSTTVWELAIHCPNTVANTYYLLLTNVTTGDTANITMTGTAAQVPQFTTLLAYRHWVCNNATAASVGIDLCSLYVEANN